MGKVTIECDAGNVSDGYHTFNELYAHRCSLFSALMKSHRNLSWKSLKHSDGSALEDWFVCGMNLPSGMITYHLPINPFWELLHDISTVQFAPEWDGHTSEDVINRLLEWISIKHEN